MEPAEEKWGDALSSNMTDVFLLIPQFEAFPWLQYYSALETIALLPLQRLDTQRTSSLTLWSLCTISSSHNKFTYFFSTQIFKK